MGAFLKIFISMLCMSIVLSIAFPGDETKFLKNDLFSKLLQEETDPLTNQTYYSGFNDSMDAAWSEGGNQDSSFLSKFIDALSVLKAFINTLINIAVLPITISIKLQMPVVVRMLVFVPLALLYILSALMTLVRGVNP